MLLPVEIVDPHLHIWDTGNLPYSLRNDVQKMNRVFSLDDSRAATAVPQLTKDI